MDKNMKNKCKDCNGIGRYQEGGTLSPFIDCEKCNRTGDGDYKYPLTFDKLREVNVARCEQVFHKIDSWSPTDWACAMGGECGEALNLIKKLKRGEKIDKKHIARELADIITYADLLAVRLNIDLGEAVREKFNIVSKRWKSKYTL